MISFESFLYVISKSDRGSNYTSTTRKVVTIMQGGNSREVAPKTVTCCLRPCKYERNQSWSLPVIPYWCNLTSNLV